MKKLLAVIVLVLGAVASAQEIGTEIAPSTPGSVAPQGQPQQKSGYVYRPSGQRANGPSFEGPKLSAGSGDVGIRAGFTASGPTTVSGTGSGTGVFVPTPLVGLSFWAADGAALNVDLGFGMVIPERGDPPLAFTVKLGLDYHFRNPGAALRPLFAVAAAFNMTLVGGNALIGASAEVGGGAAYFFSPSFSLTGKLLVSVPMVLSPSFSLAIFTLTPGLSASWYF